ncbi:hypothetical protein J6590_051532 [Homalodisca vitripennis]|nr:hypothetical protein J6590_051532 [Homalodisca vitripennis]
MLFSLAIAVELKKIRDKRKMILNIQYRARNLPCVRDCCSYDADLPLKSVVKGGGLEAVTLTLTSDAD